MGMQANLSGVVTLFTKIIQLISLADVMLTNQSLNYTNYTLAFYRKENTDPPGADKSSESWST